MSSDPPTVANELGLSNRSKLELIQAIKKGLSVKALKKVSGAVAPGDSEFKYKIVPKATLARRNKQTTRLTADESGRLTRVAHVWAFAKQVWGGEEKARAFLFRRHPLLKGARPIDVSLETDLGARLVEDILGRLRDGSAA